MNTWLYSHRNLHYRPKLIEIYIILEYSVQPLGTISTTKNVSFGKYRFTIDCRFSHRSECLSFVYSNRFLDLWLKIWFYTFCSPTMAISAYLAIYGTSCVFRAKARFQISWGTYCGCVFSITLAWWSFLDFRVVRTWLPKDNEHQDEDFYQIT